MNSSNKMVLDKCVKDLKHVKVLLSAIHTEEFNELRVTKNWNKRSQLTENSENICESVDSLYKAIGKLMRVR